MTEEAEMTRVKEPEDLPYDLAEKYPGLFSVYGSDREETIFEMANEDNEFKLLAWETNVRYLIYSKKLATMVSIIEGDIYYAQALSRKQIETKIQDYPKGEVTGYGERFDERFENRALFSEPNECPVCGSQMLDYGASEFSGDWVYFPFTCENCETDGSEESKLTDTKTVTGR